MSLTIDGKPALWNPPTVQIPMRADPTKLPVGEAKECSELDWYGLLQADEDFPDTEPAGLS